MFLEKNKKINNFFRIFVYILAIIGLIFVLVFIAMQFNLLNVKGSISSRNSYFNINKDSNINTLNTGEVKENWADTDEWLLLKEVFTRDQAIINKASLDSGVPARIILSGVIGEQLRFFNDNRESFKRYFEPMKILASLSKFSFGIAGLKPDTATLIEQHLKDSTSPFYLGPSMENVLDYSPGVDVASEQMTRITNVKDSYYSYLYVGLYMKEIEAQWSKAGYDISNRPEILATLYNLGFYKSVPNANPQAGGAVINVGGENYTFGDMGYNFYHSNELIDIFPPNK